MPSLIHFQKTLILYEKFDFQETKMNHIEKNSGAKKYKDEWNQKPVINPNNETTNLKKEKVIILYNL